MATSFKDWLHRIALLLTTPAGYADDYAEQTRQFLRWIMVFMVAGLGFSIGWQRWRSPHDCFQESISAYYYTPVRSIFVGSLLAIGVCMLSMKGKTAVEDALLNFAGVLAPVVAIVPTPPPSGASCDIPAGQGRGRGIAVANNMPSLFFIGFWALVLVFWWAHRSRGTRDAVSRGELGGYVAAAAVWVAGLVLFVTRRAFFLGVAHYTAAIGMFAAILGVVAVNAVLSGLGRRPALNRYTLIALLMIAAMLVSWVVALSGSGYWVITAETGLISLFAVFWVAQTTSSQTDMQARVAATDEQS